MTFSVSSLEIALRKGQSCPRRFPPKTFWQLVCNAFLLNVLFLELAAQSNCYDFTERFGITLYISYSLFSETFSSNLKGLGRVNLLGFFRYRILSYHLKCIYRKREKDDKIHISVKISDSAQLNLTKCHKLDRSLPALLSM